MTLILSFKNVPNDADVSIHKEDMDMARKIGVLTPREIEPTDPDDVQFLHFVDEHENMLDDIEDILEKDIIRWNNHWENCLPCEMWPVSDSTCAEIRVTEKNDGFCLGSLKYDTPWRGSRPAPNVFIQITNPDVKLDLHSFYKMEIKKNHPHEGITWNATKIFPKLSTSDMLESSVFTQIPTIEENDWQDDTATHVYRLPTPSNLIGTMIGRSGKNITSLIAEATKRSETSAHPSYGEPSITIKPTYDSSGCIVIFHEPSGCYWHKKDIEWVISHFHC
jgi:hypothetical protein